MVHARVRLVDQRYMDTHILRLCAEVAANRARDHSTADATAASIALLLHLSLPRLLFARTQRRGVNWKTIVAKRAERFLNGDWQALWNEATPAEYSVHSYAELSRQQLEALAQERGNHGDIKGAVNALQSKDLLLVRKDASVAAQWKEKSDVAGRAATMTWQEVA